MISISIVTVVLGSSRPASGTATSAGQKFVILQSRAQTPTAQQQQQQQVQVQVQQKTAQATKLVVVCMPNASHAQTTVTQVYILFS